MVHFYNTLQISIFIIKMILIFAIEVKSTKNSPELKIVNYYIIQQ